MGGIEMRTQRGWPSVAGIVFGLGLWMGMVSLLESWYPDFLDKGSIIILLWTLPLIGFLIGALFDKRQNAEALLKMTRDFEYMILWFFPDYLAQDLTDARLAVLSSAWSEATKQLLRFENDVFHGDFATPNTESLRTQFRISVEEKQRRFEKEYDLAKRVFRNRVKLRDRNIRAYLPPAELKIS